MKPAFGHQWHPQDARTRSRNGSGVGHVHRLGDEHRIARVEQTLAGGKQRGLGPSQHHHLIQIDLLAGPARMGGGDRSAQLSLAGDLGIVGPATVQACLGRSDDGCRGRIVRIANGEQNDVLAARLASERLAMDVPGGSLGSAQLVNPGRVAHRPCNERFCDGDHVALLCSNPAAQKLAIAVPYDDASLLSRQLEGERKVAPKSCGLGALLPSRCELAEPWPPSSRCHSTVAVASTALAGLT